MSSPLAAGAPRPVSAIRKTLIELFEPRFGPQAPSNYGVAAGTCLAPGAAGLAAPAIVVTDVDMEI